MKVFDTISEAHTIAFTMQYNYMAIDGTGDVYAGYRKPEYHQRAPIWSWVFDKTPARRLGWVDIGDRDFKELRFEL